MGQWGTPFPIHAESADKARLTDVDGHTYVDFNLGDSAAFFGHANPVIAQTVAREVTGRGTSFMLPTEDAIAMSENLGARFGLPLWQVERDLAEGRLLRLPTDSLGRGSQVAAETYLAHRIDQPLGPAARVLAAALRDAAR